ncbi:MAG: A/G-specific adenine glycosylase [Desulfobacterales bacterium]
MNQKDVRSFRTCLTDWYDQNQRKLPWRETRDPYRIWVSEVMLQQTQVKTVLPYYQRFCDQLPDIQTLADATDQAVLKLWEGLGYYGRARNMHRAAKVIVEQHDGAIPDDLVTIKRLPGIGDYIAAAVLSIVYHQPHAVVDGNVKRVLARMYCSDLPVNKSSSHAHYQSVASTLIDAHDPGTFNQAMMELGATVCKPRNPECDRCPVRTFCMAAKKQKVDQYPQRVKSPPTPEYHISSGVVFKGNRILITRRKSEGLLGGLWEFPGGKVMVDETPENACIREIKEEAGLTVGIRSYLTRVKHAYTHFKIFMDVYLCDYSNGRVRLNGPVDHRWIRPKEIDRYPFPGANHKFIPLLLQTIKERETSSELSSTKAQ